MENTKSLTQNEAPHPGRGLALSKITDISMLSAQQLAWVDYCVVQGLITEEDGTYKKMTVGQFAERLGVSRETLTKWRRDIPKFWDFVAERRKVIFSQTRVQKVYNAMYVKAVSGKGDVRAMQTFLANVDPNFRMPTQPVEVEAGNSWAALLNKRRNAANVQEGQVVDVNDEHNGI
ncbi:MAG: hypothetical protein KGZ81_07355 [Flavobacteriales bacterium]|nr:hypothetical protein [Flavobacteriales bacterium]